MTIPSPDPPAPIAPTETTSKLGDRIFSGISLGAGVLILVTLARSRCSSSPRLADVRRRSERVRRQ